MSRVFMRRAALLLTVTIGAVAIVAIGAELGVGNSPSVSAAPACAREQSFAGTVSRDSRITLGEQVAITPGSFVKGSYAQEPVELLVVESTRIRGIAVGGEYPTLDLHSGDPIAARGCLRGNALEADVLSIINAQA